MWVTISHQLQSCGSKCHFYPPDQPHLFSTQVEPNSSVHTLEAMCSGKNFLQPWHDWFNRLVSFPWLVIVWDMSMWLNSSQWNLRGLLREVFSLLQNRILMPYLQSSGFGRSDLEKNASIKLMTESCSYPDVYLLGSRPAYSVPLSVSPQKLHEIILTSLHFLVQGVLTFLSQRLLIAGVLHAGMAIPGLWDQKATDILTARQCWMGHQVTSSQTRWWEGLWIDLH